MATDFQTDSKNSQSRFSRFVEPALRAFGFSNVVSAEKQDSQLKRLLDFAGVDALATSKDGATMTLASRIIQKKKKPNCGDYDCFSLRNSRSTGYRTEFEKLKRAIEKNSLRPMWHCQTFIDETLNLATVGIVRTRDLVNYTATHKTKTKTTNDGANFKLVKWRDLIRAGVKVTTIKIDANGKKITA